MRILVKGRPLKIKEITFAWLERNRGEVIYLVLFLVQNFFFQNMVMCGYNRRDVSCASLKFKASRDAIAQTQSKLLPGKILIVPS